VLGHLLRRERPAELGDRFRLDPYVDRLAVDEDAVAVEDDELEAQ
jgi:hypothetical protein